jgi:hypothetical protein
LINFKNSSKDRNEGEAADKPLNGVQRSAHTKTPFHAFMHQILIVSPATASLVVAIDSKSFLPLAL